MSTNTAKQVAFTSNLVIDYANDLTNAHLLMNRWLTNALTTHVTQYGAVFFITVVSLRIDDMLNKIIINNKQIRRLMVELKGKVHSRPWK